MLTAGWDRHRDVIEIRIGAEILTLSRFALLAEGGRERDRFRVGRTLRLVRGELRAMADLRGFLRLHALLPFGHVLSDDEVLRIAEAAIAAGALDAQLTVDEKQYQPTGPPQPAPKAVMLQLRLVRRLHDHARSPRRVGTVHTQPPMPPLERH